MDKSNSLAKVGRAQEHIESLTGLVNTFGVETYSVDMQPDFWTEPQADAKGDIIIWVEAPREPPFLDWGPIIGDIVHGLRSSLDQLVWTLSVAFQTDPPPPDPIPRGNPWRGIWFPACLHRAAWDNAVARQLWAIDPTLLAGLKALQPFETGKAAPEREPLTVLNELWKIDKHRHLHLVNASVELHDVLTQEPFPGAPNIEFEVISKRPAGPLEGRTEVGRARQILRPGGMIVNLPQMHMNPSFAVDVAFGQGAPAYSGQLLHSLAQMKQAVDAILAAV